MPTNRNDQAYYKLQARKDLIAKGYNIIITVGDKLWDIQPLGGNGFLV